MYSGCYLTDSDRMHTEPVTVSFFEADDSPAELRISFDHVDDVVIKLQDDGLLTVEYPLPVHDPDEPAQRGKIVLSPLFAL